MPADGEVSGTDTSSDVQPSDDDTLDFASEDEDTGDANQWKRLTADDRGAVPVHFTETPGGRKNPVHLISTTCSAGFIPTANRRDSY